MKRLITAVLSTALVSATTSAQAIYGLSFSVESGTYEEITDGTVLFTSEISAELSDDGYDSDFAYTVYAGDAVGESTTQFYGYSIGFDYPFLGETVNKFGVSGSGYITVGSDSLTMDVTTGGYAFTSSSRTMDNIIGTANRYGVCSIKGTEISYKMTGESPDCELIVQFKNIGEMYSFWYAPVYCDFQIHLCESGDAYIVFSNMSGLTSSVNFYNAVYDGSVVAGVYGTSSSYSTLYSAPQLTLSSSDADGVTVKIAAADSCVTPASQPTDLVLSSASTSISGSFSACDDADTYLVLQSLEQTLTESPIDAVEYSSGDSIGNAVVVMYGTSTSFTASSLSGSTTYYYTVFAVGAYGTAGPKYNVTDPLTGSISTLPGAPSAITVDEVSAEGVRISVTGNEANNEVIVLYTPFRQNVRTGDYGIFGTIPASVSAGDTISLGDDYSGSDVIEPTHGGIVGYVGAPASDILLDGPETGTLYYLVAYSRDNDGNLSADGVYGGMSTIIVPPYESVMDSWPHYVLPYNWQYSTSGDYVGTWSISVTNSTTTCDDLYSQIKPGDATNGYSSWIVPQPISVNDRHISVSFNYGMTCQSTRFTSSLYYYNEWAEGDTLALQISADGGETWTTVAQYDSSNNPQIADDDDGNVVPASISADLNDYRGEEVLAKLYWKTYNVMTYGTKLTLYSLTVEQLDYPDVPDVTVSDITYNSAKVSWLSTQSSYQVAYKLSDTEEYVDTITVDTLFCELTDLETLASYNVIVRGIIATDTATTYSEWSDVVSFTTLDWPDVDAPTGLTANTDAFLTDGIVNLAWESTEDMEYYLLAYRAASSTTWTEIDSIDTASYSLEGLEANTRYLWRVKAYCTHDRVTEWSSQSNFTTPDWPEVEAPTGLAADFEAWDDDQTVVLTWDTTEDMISYVVNYKLAADEDWTEATDVTEAIYTLAGADYSADYEWRVYALCTHNRVTEWSDTATFTTPSRPAVDAPTGLSADLDAWEESETVILTWDTTDEMLTYVLAYKASAADDWTEIEDIEQASYTLEALEAETEYTWKVYALCTYDRVTEWSDEATFTTPVASGIKGTTRSGVTVRSNEGYVTLTGAEGAVVSIYNVAGMRQYGIATASDNEIIRLPAGIYLITINDSRVKVSVK